ncbi:MAG TPA: alpha/beta hydrolase [Thermoanaerobaculia bacterium]|nr:alpha/beta hydrolase [Thermoanaerobaculia bacterium]
MRRHPEHVRSAILRGVVPTDMKVPMYYARDSQRALDLLFAECAADASCRAAYPDLKAKFQTVEERLAKGPVEVKVKLSPTGDRTFPIRLSRDEFNEALRYRLYNEESNQIPKFIAQAFAGDYSLIAELTLRQRRVNARGGFIAVGMFLAVTCSEDVPFIDMAEAKRLAAGTFLGTYRVDQQVNACRSWPRGTLPAGYTDDVRSNAPALLISGLRDPVAPPRFGEQIAKGLPNSRHLVLPQGFHGLPSACVSKLMNEFVIQGTAAKLDTSCATKEEHPPFILPDPRPDAPAAAVPKGGHGGTVRGDKR